MEQTKKNVRWIAWIVSVVLLFSIVPGNAYAESPQNLTDLIQQVEELQQLADAYIQQNQSNAQALDLTINYIRSKRYTDFTWDMILGSVDTAFASYVENQSPHLGQLQQQQLITIKETGEQLDFVHLIAGIGAAYKGVAVVCTWGGDCIQLAEQIKGSSKSEEECIQALAPYFATKQENDSLFPQSDWIADLDGVNIGSALTKQSNLAEQLAAYYKQIDEYSRIYRFVQTQFGTVDTGDTASFRATVKDTFFNDSGVQLFLMSKEYITLDDNKNTVIVPSMQQPLNAVCSLMADTISTLLQGQVVTVDSIQSAPTESVESNAISEVQTAEKGDKTAAAWKTPRFFAYGAIVTAVAFLLVLVLMRNRD